MIKYFCTFFTAFLAIFMEIHAKSCTLRSVYLMSQIVGRVSWIPRVQSVYSPYPKPTGPANLLTMAVTIIHFVMTLFGVPQSWEAPKISGEVIC